MKVHTLKQGVSQKLNQSSINVYPAILPNTVPSISFRFGIHPVNSIVKKTICIKTNELIDNTQDFLENDCSFTVKSSKQYPPLLITSNKIFHLILQFLNLLKQMNLRLMLKASRIIQYIPFLKTPYSRRYRQITAIKYCK